MEKFKTKQAGIEPILNSEYKSLALVNEPLDIRVNFKILILIAKTMFRNNSSLILSRFFLFVYTFKITRGKSKFILGAFSNELAIFMNIS